MNLFLALVFLGFVGFASRKLFSASKSLLRFQGWYLQFFLPLLLFFTTALRAVDLNKSLTDASHYYFVSLSFMVLVFLGFRVLNRKLEPGVAALTATFTNTILIGAPVFEALGAHETAALLYMIIPLHALLLFGGASFLTVLWSSGKETWSLKGKLPPITWALALGALASPLISQAQEAEFWRANLTFVMQFTSIFVLGASLGGLKLEKLLEPEVKVLSGLKIIVMPVFVYGVFRLFGLRNVEAATYIAALPVGINVLSFATQFGKGAESTVSSVIFFSTLGSLVTIPCLYWAFRYVS